MNLYGRIGYSSEKAKVDFSAHFGKRTEKGKKVCAKPQFYGGKSPKMGDYRIEVLRDRRSSEPKMSQGGLGHDESTLLSLSQKRIRSISSSVMLSAVRS